MKIHLQLLRTRGITCVFYPRCAKWALKSIVAGIAVEHSFREWRVIICPRREIVRNVQVRDTTKRRRLKSESEAEFVVCQI
jgi:hypothetical protein